MHVVSFYSFKGGVGRTMAVANVGYELARIGRRVLLVDFDLEAPGLASYGPFSSLPGTPGVVDYVVDYLETGEAPDARGFLMRYEGADGDAAVPLWLMPAGRRGVDYAARLASIDWADLYDARSGYLLFEDLKQQWAAMDERFDYVLVDSRTGLTDVAGICTRQLPDTVCLMFLPNDQNIDGLDTVAAAIRAGDTLERRTRMLFCPSNVPTLDDEFEILKGKLDKARERLGYDEPAAMVHRYDSLALIDQAIFVRDRPTTRLAEEMRKLAGAVMRGNLRDREGALVELDSLRTQLQGRRSDLPRSDAGGRSFLTSVTERLAAIRKFHPRDGEVGLALAGVYGLLGDSGAQFEALSTAIADGYRTTDARLMRGLSSLALGRREEAVTDLEAVISSRDTSSVDLWAALEALQDTGIGWLETLRSSEALERLAPDDKLRVTHLLKFDVGALPLATEIAAEVRATSHDEILRQVAQTELSLSLIGSGEFGRAMEILGPTREDVLTGMSVTRAFNYAMAEWGHLGEPQPDMLAHTLKLAGDWSGVDANFEQCLAMCHALTSNPGMALERVRKARELVGPGSVFSCWRYLRVSGPEMLDDLDALARMAEGGGERPTFIDATRR